jgi:hypothetical protein
MTEPRKLKEQAVHTAFEDVLGGLRVSEHELPKGTTVGEDTMDGAHLASLLEMNFSKLDPNNNGITKEELAKAMLTPWEYSVDEYTMLKLLGKYFDTIIHMSDDEQGPETVITEMDKDVLIQFLRFGGMTLKQLQVWRSADNTPDA